MNKIMATESKGRGMCSSIFHVDELGVWPTPENLAGDFCYYPKCGEGATISPVL